MDNWELILENGEVLTEKEALYWDNVPIDKKIKKATFILLNGSKLIFEKFTSLCIARLGATSVNGDSMRAGYRITERQKEDYNDFVITSHGINKTSGKISQLTISETCFRLGVN